MQGDEMLARRPSSFDVTEITVTPADDDQGERTSPRSPSPEEIPRSWGTSPTPIRQRLA